MPHMQMCEQPDYCPRCGVDESKTEARANIKVDTYKEEEMSNENTITINGTEYVRADSREVGEHVCVICTNGWIFEGRINDSAQDMTLTDAHNVRSWSNGRGLGAIAKPEYKDEYKLDPVGTIRLNPDAVIGQISLEW